LFNLSYNRFIALIIAFSLNYAAYFGEIFRSGIESIPIGQKEAAFTLGFNKLQTFFLIIFPQAIKKTIPSISNEVITLVRDTSLAQVIGITELFSLAQKQANFRFSIIPLILAAIIYLGISLILTIIFNYVEKKLNYYRG
jgi:polar amino acid transport system permease protein